MSEIVSKPATAEYREGWDRIFGKPEDSERLHRYLGLVDKRNELAVQVGIVEAHRQMSQEIEAAWNELTEEERNYVRSTR